MKTDLVQTAFEVDVAAMALAHTLGRTERAEEVRQRLKTLRLSCGRLVLAELAARPEQIEPAEAVRLVIEAAMAAGIEWPTIVAAVNSASEKRLARAK